MRSWVEHSANLRLNSWQNNNTTYPEEAASKTGIHNNNVDQDVADTLPGDDDLWLVTGISHCSCCLCEFLTFGRNKASSAVTDDVAKSFLDKFAAAGGVEVDCARIYAGGESEEMLGRVLAGLPWLSRRSTLWP